MPDLTGFERKCTVGSGGVELAAHLVIPGKAAGAVVVADGGESGRRHPGAHLALALNQAGPGAPEEVAGLAASDFAGRSDLAG